MQNTINYIIITKINGKYENHFVGSFDYNAKNVELKSKLLETFKEKYHLNEKELEIYSYVQAFVENGKVNTGDEIYVAVGKFLNNELAYLSRPFKDMNNALTEMVVSETTKSISKIALKSELLNQMNTKNKNDFKNVIIKYEVVNLPFNTILI